MLNTRVAKVPDIDAITVCAATGLAPIAVANGSLLGGTSSNLSLAYFRAPLNRHHDQTKSAAGFTLATTMLCLRADVPPPHPAGGSSGIEPLKLCDRLPPTPTAPAQQSGPKAMRWYSCWSHLMRPIRVPLSILRAT